MAGFIYYLPHSLDLKPEAWQERRRAVIGGLPCARRGCSGPDDATGLLLVPQVAAPPRCRYDPPSQTWRKAPGGWWLGWQTDTPPGPDDVIRADAVRINHPVELADGNEWLVPVARLVSGDTGLPQVLDLTEDGTLQPIPDERYRPILDAAEQLWSRIMDALGQVSDEDADEDGGIEIDVQADRRLAVDALTINYHLGVEEIGLLRLLGTESANEVIGALVDAPGMRRCLHAMAQKKSETDASSNGDSGARETPAATSPPTPTTPSGNADGGSEA